MSGQNGFSISSLGLGRNSLDAPVAMLASLAAAFAAFAVPADQLAAVVGLTGLPAILPAAEPPLGSTARIGLGAAGALFVFALVFGLLRLLDRKPRRAVANRVEAPRIRRRDAHPDAPAPRPISAMLDLGEPSEGSAVPAWLAPADLGGEGQVVPQTMQRDEADVPAWLAPTDRADEAQVESEAVQRHEVQVEPAPAQPNLRQRSNTIDWEALRQLDALTPAAPNQPERFEGQSVAELMARLERGLARRPQARRAASTVEASGSDPAPNASPEDDRLQSAIDSLHRFASRQA